MTEGIKKPCERCGEIKELKQYEPNLGKNPGKVLTCCDDCAGKDGKLIAVVQPADVPEINPVIPEEATETIPIVPGIKEFKAVAFEPIKLATPISEPKPEQLPTKVPSTEPISRDDIRAKLTACEEDANSLLGNKKVLLEKLQEIQRMLNVTNVRIANYRDLLDE